MVSVTPVVALLRRARHMSTCVGHGHYRRGADSDAHRRYPPLGASACVPQRPDTLGHSPSNSISAQSPHVALNQLWWGLPSKLSLELGARRNPSR